MMLAARPYWVHTKANQTDNICYLFPASRNHEMATISPSSPPELESLLEQIGDNQDRTAFALLFKQVAPKLKAFAMRNGMSEDDAEEVLQETMVTVWNKAASYNPDKASATTWLYTIMRNKRIDMFRKYKPNMIVSEDLFPEPATEELEITTANEIEAEQTRKLLEALPESQRQIIYKAYFEGKSHSEIAEDVGLPLGTIKSRIRLAMQKLHQLTQNISSWLIIILPLTF